MDRNFLLAFALSFAVLTGWMYLQAERRRALEEAQPAVVEGVTQPAETPQAAPPEPGATAARRGEVRETPAARPPVADAEPIAPAQPEERIRIEGAQFAAELTSHGGALAHWELLDYTEADENGRRRIVLTTAGEGPYAATPLRGLGFGDLSRASFRVEAASDDAVSFVFERDGVRVRKRWGFDRQGYGFRFSVEVENGSDRMVSPRFEVRWPAAVREGIDYREQALIALHAGEVDREMVAGIGTAGFFGSLFGGGGENGELTRYSDIGWAGLDLRYFLAALVPDRGRDAHVVFEPIETGESGATVIGFDPVDLPPGQRSEREFRGFAGPKRPEQLDAFGADLERGVNRGWSFFAPLVRGFEWLLAACYAVIPNYGVAIIVLTILVRLVTAPIMAKQMRSMERMRELQPRMKEIQEKYADDRQKQSEAMMKMYREVGFNPLGGCLPMFLQLPVFIGLFYALQSSFELRQASFVGWIDDLSAPESLFVLPGLEIPVRLLPLLMGASMVVQQKLTPTTIDPAQARMMTVVMPVMFVVLFYQFPSGLVLYWMMSNLLGIAHQMWINRKKKT